ncbi:MAG: hypothetical protein ACI38Q_02315 [Candidatus Bruticola sp.]
MRRYNLWALILAFTVFYFAYLPSAWAADVVLGGQVVFRITDEEQAGKISKKIEAMLQRGASSASIKVVRKETTVTAEGQDQDDDSKGGAKAKKSVYKIFWGSELVIEVNDEIAKQNASSPEALANLWASNMRNVVDIGLLNVDTARAVLPIDADKVIYASGLATGPLIVEEASGVVDIDIDQENGLIKIKGRKVGKSSLIISKGAASVSVFVQVKDWAGKLPQTVNVEVTGNPAQVDAVSQAVMLSIAANTFVQPGCSVYVDDSNFRPIPVSKGDSMRLSVPVGINASEDYFALRGNVNVIINNIEAPAVEQNLLLVSNRPERVNTDGVLMKYNFKRREPSRLMFSHLNASEKNRYLWINLSNLNDEPVKVVISRTSAGPERSEIYVGQTAARRFLENLACRSGYVITLPPNSALELCSYTMRPEALVSGFINFQILEGSSATVEVRSSLDPNANDGRPLPEIGAPFNPFKIHPHGVFAQPYFENEGEFVVGGSPLTFRYGESPWLIDFETGLPNTGNFGVLYKSLVELKNPTKRTKTVGLYFTPLSGPGGANFLIGDSVYQAVFRKKGDEVLVAKIELLPESSSMIEIVTLPEATSCYPAQYELREL